MKIEHTKIKVMSNQLTRVAQLQIQMANLEKEISVLRESYEMEIGRLKNLAKEL